MEEHLRQCPQQVHIHPIVYQAQMPQLAAQYVPESGACADEHQGYLQGQYI